MSIDGIAAIVFIVLLALFLWNKRKQVQLQRALFPLLYVVMYRSKFGLRSMDRLAKKFPRTLRATGDVSIILGFIGMVLICAELIKSTVQMVMRPDGIPGIQPVLPIEAKGVFFVPFLYWILSIFLLALVHEFSHGVLARAHNMPVKSSGFAFLCVLLPVIPAAFVEPDEKVVNKRPFRQQLSVFAAGPISNMVFALLAFGIFSLLLTPVLTAAYDSNGIELVGVEEDSPAFIAGLREGDVMLRLNDQVADSIVNVTKVLNGSLPGDEIAVETTKGSVMVALTSHPKNESKAFMGIRARPHLEMNAGFVAAYGAWVPPATKWLAGLVFWLLMLNVGIGLFNLLPIGPLDGGRMFQVACLKMFKKKQTALKVWAYTSVFFVVLIVGNLVIGFVR